MSMTVSDNYKRGWILYQTNRSSGYGLSAVFDTYEEALNAQVVSSFFETRIVPYTYQLEEDQLHDCGDDND